MLKYLLLFVLLSLPVLIQAQEPQPPPPNATVCTPGISLCDGTNYNCVCQNGGVCSQGPGGQKTNCTCPSPQVWGGNFCEIPMCVGLNFPNGCQNGVCIGPGSCECNPGWRGFDCSIPIECTPGVSSCLAGTNCSCLNGGTCGGPQKTVCSCPNGYASDFCEVIVCNGVNFPAGCHTGQCIHPQQCQCNPGWNGTDCGQGICDPPCIYGTCVAAGVCQCFPGFAHCPNAYSVCGCDDNECERAHPVCDPLTKCTNLFGSFNCTKCPPGYPGSPYITYPNMDIGNYTLSMGGCNVTIPTTGAPPPTSLAATSAVHTSASTTGSAAVVVTTTVVASTSVVSSTNSPTDSNGQQANATATVATDTNGQSAANTVATTVPTLNGLSHLVPSILLIIISIVLL